MLQPKKTKFRRQQKGRQKGIAQRGNQLAFGSFGIKALETKWITGRQIEDARIAVTRYMPVSYTHLGCNIPKEFIPSVQKGFTTAMKNGVSVSYTHLRQSWIASLL